MRSSISPEPALLGFLLSGPLHGYDLFRRVDKELGPIWRLGMSQMYAIVGNYERQGWIGARLESQENHPARKMLQLTPAGRQAFDAWLDETAHGMRELRVDFFLRLYFARQAGPAQTSKLIDRQREAIRRELALLKTASAATPQEQNSFHRLARDFRINQLSTVLRWLDAHRAELKPHVTAGSHADLSYSVARRSRRRRRPNKNRKAAVK